MGWLLDDHTIEWAIRNFTTEWYIEYKDANQKIIDAFHRPAGNAIGHFTMLVNDKQTKGNERVILIIEIRGDKKCISVGCGLVKFTKRLNNWDYNVHVFACNYSWTNIFTLPVYKKGKNTSGCLTGKHYYYEGLCSDAEQIKGGFYWTL